MKLEKLIGERFRERPADCVIDSHALMVKGGYMKYMAPAFTLPTFHSNGSHTKSSRSCVRRWIN